MMRTSMTKQTGILVIFAGSVFLAACGGANDVNNAPPNGASPAETAGAPAASTAGTTGSSAAPGTATSATAGNALTSGGSGSTAAPAPAEPAFREVSIPDGTKLPLELLTSVSSETSTVEAPVRARLTRDVEINGIVAMPSG